MKYYVTSHCDIGKILHEHPYGVPLVMEMESDTYFLNEFAIPYGCPYVEIIGNGSNINFSDNGFICLPGTQQQALDVGTNSRYIIRDFNSIHGGANGVHIGGSFGTQIRNINFVGQSLSAITLEFALMSKISSVLVTNPWKHGIILDSGSWSKASIRNSQCNHTVLEQCRVYSRGQAGYSYIIKNSSGIVLRDCIAEGHPNTGAVLYSAKDNPVVKNFKIENFHLEYAPTEFGIHISAGGATSNIIDGLYVSSNNVKYPVYIDRNSPVQLKNIGWWDDKWKIYSTHSAPRIIMDQCNYRLNYYSVYCPDKAIFKPYVRVVNPIIA